MKGRFSSIIFLVALLLFAGCNSDTSSNPRKNGSDTTRYQTIKNDSIQNSNNFSILGDPIDTSGSYGIGGMGPGTKSQFEKVKNLLEFFVRDTMKTDSTYVATLAMATDISSAELEIKTKDIVDPDAKVMVKDTTQEISLQMSASLEDKSSPNDPNFLIRLIGSTSNVRTYNAKKNKMIWQWNVTPLKAGLHELLLSISQVDNNEHVIGSPETRRHAIIIFSEKKKPGFFKSIGNFFSNNGQWLVGAIIIPIFIAWYTVRLKRRLERKSSQKEQ